MLRGTRSRARVVFTRQRVSTLVNFALLIGIGTRVLSHRADKSETLTNGPASLVQVTPRALQVSRLCQLPLFAPG